MNKALHSCRKCPNNSGASTSSTPTAAAASAVQSSSPICQRQAFPHALTQALQVMSLGSSPWPIRDSTSKDLRHCQDVQQALITVLKPVPSHGAKLCIPELKHVHTYTSEKKHLRQHTRYTDVYSIQYAREMSKSGETWDMRTWIESTWECHRQLGSQAGATRYVHGRGELRRTQFQVADVIGACPQQRHSWQKI